LVDLADEWAVFHRGRLKVDMPASAAHFRLSSRERAVLDFATGLATHAKASASARVRVGQNLRVVYACNSHLEVQGLEQWCVLWSGIAPTVQVRPTRETLDIDIERAPVPGQPGPVTRAALTLFDPPEQPFASAVADLLHEIKNQISAAGAAASAPTTTRRDALERDVTAMRHLDQAHAFAERLQINALLPARSSGETVEVAAYLRSYVTMLLPRLPLSVSLVTPRSTGPIVAATGKPALQVVLNNLVNNSLEALPGGGIIGLAVQIAGQEIVIDVWDDGPGLPGEVVSAVVEGRRVHSTKPGGNGIGLLGAQRIMNRLGGGLEIASTNDGTRWQLRLPLATTNSAEDS
jgi:signal transduction histidine kinase